MPPTRNGVPGSVSSTSLKVCASPSDSRATSRLSKLTVTAFRISFRSLPIRGRSSRHVAHAFTQPRNCAGFPQKFHPKIFKGDFAVCLLDFAKRRFLQSLKIIVHQETERALGCVLPVQRRNGSVQNCLECRFIAYYQVGQYLTINFNFGRS